MKNKRWKRKAKRVIGMCIKNKYFNACDGCIYTDECIHYCDFYTPERLGIREVEKRYKERGSSYV